LSVATRTVNVAEICELRWLWGAGSRRNDRWCCTTKHQNAGAQTKVDRWAGGPMDRWAGVPKGRCAGGPMGRWAGASSPCSIQWQVPL